jgi:multidrug efflux pump subunit AcrA (membrane-fusion protein)
MNDYEGSGKIRDIYGRLSGRIKLTILIISAAIIISILFINVKLPYTISTFGQIQPSQRWILTSGTDGQLIASTVNYKTGVSDGYRVSQFAREGTMSLQLRRDAINGDYLHAGDTVATIYSSETNERLTQLKGQLETMRASLIANSHGEKEAVLRGLEAALGHAREKADNQQRIFERQRALYQRQLITQEEYDIAESENRLLSIEVDIARTQLESAATGAKPEEIEYLKTEITALANEVNTLEQRIASFSIVSPISGKITRVYAPDTLIIVSDISTHVVLIPIQSSDAIYVRSNQDIEIDTNGRNGTVRGHMVLIDEATHFIKGQQTCMGTAIIDSCATELSLGMISRCKVICDRVTLGEYIKRMIKIL